MVNGRDPIGVQISMNAAPSNDSDQRAAYALVDALMDLGLMKKPEIIDDVQVPLDVIQISIYRKP